MVGKSPYWEWEYYLTTKWQPPAGVDKLKMVGFAVILASFGTHGKEIFPSAAKVAERAGVSESTAKRLRRDVVKLGLFRETKTNHGRVKDLEIATPAAEPTEQSDPWEDGWGGYDDDQYGTEIPGDRSIGDPMRRSASGHSDRGIVSL